MYRWLKIAKRPEPNPELCLPSLNDPSLIEEESKAKPDHYTLHIDSEKCEIAM